MYSIGRNSVKRLVGRKSNTLGRFYQLLSQRNVSTAVLKKLEVSIRNETAGGSSSSTNSTTSGARLGSGSTVSTGADHIPSASYSAFCRSPIFAPRVVLEDELGSELAGNLGKSYHRDLITSTGSDLGASYLPYKTRYFDDAVEKWIAENHESGFASQVVILGAGMDTRAFRLPNVNKFKATVFEVDFSEVLKTKSEKLSKCEHPLIAKGTPQPSCGATRVEIPGDLRDSDWIEKLTSNPAFDPEKRICFILEGVSPYLDAGHNQKIFEVVNQLVSNVKSGGNQSFAGLPLDNMVSNRGCLILGDFTHGFLVEDHGWKVPAFNRTLQFLERTNTPWLYGPRRVDAEFSRTLKLLRWRQVEMVTVQELHDQYVKKLGRKTCDLRLALKHFTEVEMVKDRKKLEFEGKKPVDKLNDGDRPTIRRQRTAKEASKAADDRNTETEDRSILVAQRRYGGLKVFDLATLGIVFFRYYILGNAISQFRFRKSKYQGKISQYVYKFEK